MKPPNDVGEIAEKIVRELDDKALTGLVMSYLWKGFRNEDQFVIGAYKAWKEGK